MLPRSIRPPRSALDPPSGAAPDTNPMTGAPATARPDPWMTIVPFPPRCATLVSPTSSAKEAVGTTCERKQASFCRASEAKLVHPGRRGLSTRRARD